MDAEKAFGKSKHPLRTKTLSKLEIQKDFLNVIKDIWETLTANTTLMVKHWMISLLDQD